MGAYKSDVVNYIHGCLFSMGAYFKVYEDVSSFVIRHWNSNTSSSLYFVDAVIWCCFGIGLCASRNGRKGQ